MANQEHVEMLKKGFEVWNKWRENNPDIKLDFRGSHLSRTNLRGTDLIEANLREANLRETDLIGVNLSRADITGAVLYFTFRDYWKIENIRCDYIFWDFEGKERTPKDRDFKPGEFEELYKWRPLNDFERLIKRSIEFPPEYKQAGVSILNYFSEILRKKYPESEAKVQIKQDGLKVTMIIDPAEGEREVIEKTLNDYGLVITGKMLPEEFTSDKHQIIELRSELRIAQVRIEMQKELLQDKSAQVDKLLSMVGNAVRTPHHIHISNQASGGNIGDNTINAHDIANSKLVAGNDNIS